MVTHALERPDRATDQAERPAHFAGRRANGSFAKAANQLAVSHPVVSRSISDLEHVLGVVRMVEDDARPVHKAIVDDVAIGARHFSGKSDGITLDIECAPDDRKAARSRRETAGVCRLCLHLLLVR